MRQAVLAVVTIVLALTAPGPLWAADVDDLKAAHEQLFKAVNSLDAAALAAGIHDGAVNFPRNDAFPGEAPAECGRGAR